MRLLAVESSCDESSVAVIKDRSIESICTKTQAIHAAYGGVVPELAGRSHLELLSELAEQAMEQASITPRELDGIAVTRGPGLVGSLLVGLNFARGLAHGWGLPFQTIHHIEAHLWSPEIEHSELPLPFLCLLVSGGHTQLVHVTGVRQYQIIGQTLDDAVGEAYDKVGKMLGLTFPAGADMDKLAKNGDASAFPLPTPLNDSSCDFSFSGLKTAVLYRMRDRASGPAVRADDIAASFQQAAVGALIAKCEHALALVPAAALACAGGVAANSLLRSRLEDLAAARGIPCLTAKIKYCADNAAMIGYLACKLRAAGVFENDDRVLPRWPLTDLASLQTTLV